MATTKTAVEFTAPAVQATFDGVLFDNDGTLVDSTYVIEKYWRLVAGELGFDADDFLANSHGRRTIDMLKIYAPHKATWEYVLWMEERLPRLYGHEATQVPGARALLDDLSARSFPWAIVTSGTVPLLTGWLRAVNLPMPELKVTSEYVVEGKPNPECYLMGLDKLGLAPPAVTTGPDQQDRRRQQQQQGQSRGPEVVVFEDAPAGIKAAKAAGCKVVAVVTSHTAEKVLAAGPDWVVKDLASVRVVQVSEGEDGKRRVTLEFRDGLVVPGTEITASA